MHIFRDFTLTPLRERKMSVHIQDMGLNSTRTVKILIRIFLLLSISFWDSFCVFLFFPSSPLPHLMMHTSWKKERKEGRESKGKVCIFYYNTSAKEKELLRSHCNYAAISSFEVMITFRKYLSWRTYKICLGGLGKLSLIRFFALVQGAVWLELAAYGWGKDMCTQKADSRKNSLRQPLKQLPPWILNSFAFLCWPVLSSTSPVIWTISTAN